MSITVLVLALLVGAVGFVVTAARRLQGQGLNGQMIRRGFQYGVLYILVLIVANGATDLLGRLFGVKTQDGDDFLLAQSLTAIVIALPIAGLLSWWIYRTHRRDPAERASLLYQAYLTAAALTGAALTAAKLHQVLTTAIGAQELNADALAGVIVWTVVWVVHWWIMQRTLTQSDTTAHVLLGSSIGLVLAAGGLIELLATALELFTTSNILVGTYVGLGSATGMLIGGVVVWAVYWLAAGIKLPRTTSWHTYTFLLGVAGGLTAALAGAHAVVWRGLVQLFGEPMLLAAWFDWPEALATMVIGTTVWWYHGAIIDPTQLTPVRRIYQYLVAGIGALAAASGIGLLVVALLDSIAPASLFHHPLNSLLGALPLIVIGAAVWWAHWHDIQDAAHERPDEELTAAVRRIYLVILLGGSAAAAVIVLISGVVDVVHDLVQGQLGLATLFEVRTEAGVLAASAALIAYHAAILRQDQRYGPTKAVRHGTLTLVGPIDPNLEAALAPRIDGPIRLLPIEVPTTWDIDAILAALETYAPDEDVVVIARERGIEAHPAQALHNLR